MGNENEVTETEETEEALVVCDMENPDPSNDGQVQVTATKDKKVAKIYYNFGVDLATMTQLFGDEVVFGYARGQMIIRLQATMRARLTAGGDLEGLVSEFKPGLTMPKTPKDMKKATENYFMSLNQDEQNALIAKLMDKKG